MISQGNRVGRSRRCLVRAGCDPASGPTRSQVWLGCGPGSGSAAVLGLARTRIGLSRISRKTGGFALVGRRRGRGERGRGGNNGKWGYVSSRPPRIDTLITRNPTNRANFRRKVTIRRSGRTTYEHFPGFCFSPQEDAARAWAASATSVPAGWPCGREDLDHGAEVVKARAAGREEVSQRPSSGRQLVPGRP